MSALLFFKNQSKITSLKTTIFEEYITSYLIRKASLSQECYIADLFCVSGKNGKKDGSPLIIINLIRKLFQLKYVYNNFKITIFLNDIDKEKIRILHRKIFKDIKNKNINIKILNDSFHSAYPELLKSLKGSYKLFLLDPFGYSDIAIEDLQKIFSMPNTEILLFIPIFYAYRFSNYQQAKGKVKEFLKTFTAKGIYPYKNVYSFSKAIVSKLSRVLGTKYIREIILKDRSQINALFLITKDIKSFVAANNIFWQHTCNGKDISSDITKTKKLNIAKKLTSVICNIKKRLLNKKNFCKEIIQYLLLKGLSEKQFQIIFAKLNIFLNGKNTISKIQKYWYNIYKYG